MKKIILDFKKNTETIERRWGQKLNSQLFKANRVVEKAAYSVVAMANLVRCKEIIKKLPEGQEMLQRAKNDGVRIISDMQMKGGGALVYKTQLADAAPRIEAGPEQRIHIAGAHYGVNTGSVMHDIFHECQHQKQFREGLSWPNSNNFEDYKVWRRFQEADAESFAIAMSHKYAKNGIPQAWDACKDRILHKHIAEDIEAAEKKMGRDLSFKEVRERAFEGWFDDKVAWLVADYDRDAGQSWKMEREKHKHGLAGEAPHSELKLQDFKKYNEVAGTDLIKDQSEGAFRQKRYFAHYDQEKANMGVTLKTPASAMTGNRVKKSGLNQNMAKPSMPAPPSPKLARGGGSKGK